MAGIYDRVAPGGNRISSHLLKAAVYLRSRGVFTSPQILSGLNTATSVPLSAAAEADLNTVLTNATTGTAIEKIDYLERWDALNIAVEAGLLTNEATYRTQAGLT